MTRTVTQSVTPTVTRPVHYLSTLSFDAPFLDRLQTLSPRVQVEQITAATAADIPPETWASVDVLHTAGVFPPPGAAPRLAWIQLDTSGVDHLLDHPVWQTDVPITTLGGVGPVTMAEYVILAVLGLAHRLPALIECRADRRWPAPSSSAATLTPAPVRGTTMVILGYGRIGEEIARLALPFGVRVIGVNRSGVLASDLPAPRYDGRVVDARPAAPAVRPTDSSAAISFAAAGGDVVLAGLDRLDEVLAFADWLVVVLPRTGQTVGLIDASRLARLPAGAMVVNASRGGIVDEGALLSALRSGRVAGVVLDVFDEEPLDFTSPWWDEPGVFITPHVAGLTSAHAAHVEKIVAENVRRFLAGEPLCNVVDRARGY